MTLSYDEIFSYFLGSVTDYDFVSFDESEADEFMTELLRKSFSQPYIRRLFSTESKLDDEIMRFTFEMDYIVDDSFDTDFVVDVLAKGMIVEWLKPQVRSKKYISQMFATKEQKFFSQSQHLSELRGLLEDTELELRKTIRDRGYIYNTYLDS